MSLTEIKLNARLVIIEPEGAQGVKLGLQISSAEMIRSFDEAVGSLPIELRNDPTRLAEIAKSLNIPVVKP